MRKPVCHEYTYEAFDRVLDADITIDLVYYDDGFWEPQEDVDEQVLRRHSVLIQEQITEELICREEGIMDRAIDLKLLAWKEGER